MAALRILLVDDESALLVLIKRHLERAGHSVVACLSAEIALEELQTSAWHPEFLIADETLPGLSGTAFAAALVDRFPRLPVLLCSGYAMSIETLPTAVRVRAAFLHKPYTPGMLERAIDDLLV